MNAQIHIVEVDRIVLEGLDVRPQRAERVRALIEAELQRRLEQEKLPERVASGDVSLAAIPALDIALSALSDQEVADLLVERIIELLRYAESSNAREDEHV
jgi:hypothetical protein